MSAVNELMAVLKEEEAVLKDRKFEDLPALQRRKEQLLAALDGVDDKKALERLHNQAARNESLMAVAMTAIRGLRTRMGRMAEDQGAVGYSADGSRMGVEAGTGKRRV